ncbi:hypothetical protein TRVA0_033S01288 [Trichomonascus vanleenenianus]|uniref:uncharacterized protein n=1 Tax=Trichomonascus vanleenenianus TaxID=2268995 RepID=UPI003EC98158
MPRLSKKVALHTDPRFQDIVKRTFYVNPPFYYIPSGKRNVYCAPHCKARSAQKIKQIVDSGADAEALGYERCQRCRNPPPEIKLLMALHYIQQHPEDNLKNITAAVGWSRAHGHRYIRHLTLKTPKQLCTMTKSGVDIVSYYTSLSNKPDMVRHLNDQLHELGTGRDVSIAQDAVVSYKRQTSHSPSSSTNTADNIEEIDSIAVYQGDDWVTANIASPVTPSVTPTEVTSCYILHDKLTANCSSNDDMISQGMEVTFTNICSNYVQPTTRDTFPASIHWPMDDFTADEFNHYYTGAAGLIECDAFMPPDSTAQKIVSL